MRKWRKTAPEDLWFVRRYCLAKTYPARDVRCRYAKAEIIAKSSDISTGKTDLKDVDGIFPLLKSPLPNIVVITIRPNINISAMFV